MPALFSIRYGTPLLILACTVALAGYTAHRDRRAAEALVQGHAVSQMMTRMEALSALVGHAFSTEPPDQAQERLAVFAAGLSPDEAAVAGPSAIVLAATRPQWVGQPLFGTAELRAGVQADESLEAVVERVRGLRLPEVHVSGSGSQVVGFCPVEFGGAAPSRAGVLIIQRDLSRALAAARATAEQNAAEMAATLAILAAALGVLIHFAVIRRLYVVVRAAGQFAEGKLDTRTRLKGRDEVAALGRAFDHMADQVAGQQRELERRVLERTEDLARTVAELEEEVKERQRAARELSHQALHDALTGLSNRRAFEQRLAKMLEAAAGAAAQTLLYLDLDNFKVVNDTCGHAAGDELLRQLAELIAPKVRKDDLLARLGGDEFGILLEDCPEDNALRVARNLRSAINDFRFAWQEHRFAVSASIGLVPIQPGLDTMASALGAADIACHAAKEQGGNRIHVHQPGDSELARRQGEMQWVPRLQQALLENRLMLFYQPIVHLAEPERIHGEILVRLRMPDGSLVMPSAFIPAAERYHQMQQIDRWIVGNSFEAIKALRDVAPVRPCVSINLSGQSIGDADFLEYVERQAQQTGVPLDCVCFEVTETAAIGNVGAARRFFTALKRRGCRFALDDFGSGLSSFAYLKTLPVDFLKIDGCFVRHLAEDPIDYAMVEAINRIGHVMGIETIAEFVEDEPILSRLRAIGVDYGQGYGLGKPMPFGEFLRQVSAGYWGRAQPKLPRPSAENKPLVFRQR